MDLWTEVWLLFVQVTDSLPCAAKTSCGGWAGTGDTRHERNSSLAHIRRITGLIQDGFREDTVAAVVYSVSYSSGPYRALD